MSDPKLIDPEELFGIESNEQGNVDAFFSIEHGNYTVVLLAERRWTTPTGKHFKKRVTQVFRGSTPERCADAMRDAGWEPPENLGQLCGSKPGRRVSRRKSR